MRNTVLRSIFEHDPLDLLTRTDPVTPRDVSAVYGFSDANQARGLLRGLGYSIAATGPEYAVLRGGVVAMQRYLVATPPERKYRVQPILTEAEKAAAEARTAPDTEAF